MTWRVVFTDKFFKIFYLIYFFYFFDVRKNMAYFSKIFDQPWFWSDECLWRLFYGCWPHRWERYPTLFFSCRRFFRLQGGPARVFWIQWVFSSSFLQLWVYLSWFWHYLSFLMVEFCQLCEHSLRFSGFVRHIEENGSIWKTVK